MTDDEAGKERSSGEADDDSPPTPVPVPLSASTREVEIELKGMDPCWRRPRTSSRGWPHPVPILPVVVVVVFGSRQFSSVSPSRWFTQSFCSDNLPLPVNAHGPHGSPFCLSHRLLHGGGVIAGHSTKDVGKRCILTLPDPPRPSLTTGLLDRFVIWADGPLRPHHHHPPHHPHSTRRVWCGTAS